MIIATNLYGEPGYILVDDDWHVQVDVVSASTITVTSTDLVKAATTPNEYNVTMTNADTEYSQALPSSCKRFQIRVRDGTAARFAFTTGKVAGSTAPYFTLMANEVYKEDNLSLSSKTVYFACGSSGKIMEIIAWS